jgi:hypothetical protein
MLRYVKFLWNEGIQMTHKFRNGWSSALVLAALLFALQSTASYAQSRIGQAATVRPEAHANTRQLAPGADVHANETIRTGTAGVADLRFIDNTNLSVGPASTVRLDKFVYDPNRGTGSVTFQASRGAFRFVTGSQSRGDYKVRTPYGTLGVRG